MPEAGSPIARAFGWLRQQGLSETELNRLNSCTPGEFLLPEGIYVNTGADGVTFSGSGEATLPFVDGRWDLIPAEIVAAHPELRRDPRPVAQAPRLVR